MVKYKLHKENKFKTLIASGNFLKFIKDKIYHTILSGVFASMIIFGGYQIYYVFSNHLFNSTPSEEEQLATMQQIQNNDKFIESNIDTTIFVISKKINTSYNSDYQIINDQLYYKDEPITLTNSSMNISFLYCNINENTLANIDLLNSKSEAVNLQGSTITNECVNYLPSSVKELSLSDCSFITNLESLPNKCPHIQTLYLNCLPSLNNLDFIYNLKELKKIFLRESPYITQELLDYLNENGIEHNITYKDVNNNIETNKIVENLIKPEMSDSEKIKEISLYTINHIKYNIDKTVESNTSPLTLPLETEEGVCASYAYLANVLLNKAGITAYVVEDYDHAWNVVKLNDKYYYLDTTNFDGNYFYNLLLRLIGITKYYLTNPNNDFLASYIAYDSPECLIANNIKNEIKTTDYGLDIGSILAFLSFILDLSSIVIVILGSDKLKKEIDALKKDIDSYCTNNNINLNNENLNEEKSDYILKLTK